MKKVWLETEVLSVNFNVILFRIEFNLIVEIPNQFIVLPQIKGGNLGNYNTVIF